MSDPLAALGPLARAVFGSPPFRWLCRRLGVPLPGDPPSADSPPLREVTGPPDERALRNAGRASNPCLLLMATLVQVVSLFAIAGALTWAIAGPRQGWGRPGVWHTCILALLSCLNALTWACLSRWHVRIRKAARPALARLSRSDDVRDAPALADAAWAASPGDRGEVVGALRRLLARLTDADNCWMTDEHRRALHQLASLCPDEETAVALLRAMQKVGDAGDLAVVRRIAAGRAPGVVSRRPAVREAARQCLTVLEARIAAARSEAALVRPSAAEPALVRPAAGAQDERAAVLARASVEPDGDHHA